MNQHRPGHKRYIYAVILIFWLIPFLQDQFRFFRPEGLRGAFQAVKMPSFSVDSFAAGQFAEQMELYQNHHSGFRPWLVRTRNQVHFTLLNKIYSHDVVFGQQDYIFEQHYIDAVTGKNFIGSDSADYRCHLFKQVKDSLAAHGIQTLVVMAPGKGWFHRDKLPDGFGPAQNGNTNYEAYVKAFAKYDIPLIDCNNWFMNMKATAPYPLYTKLGIHWSNYGAYLASDSMLRYLQTMMPRATGRIELKKMNLEKHTRNFDDADLFSLLNLFEKFDDEDVPWFAYPEIGFKQTTYKPRALFIGDSFYWNWATTQMPYTLFDRNSHFWYYGRTQYNTDVATVATNLNETNWEKEIQTRELVLFIFTEANLLEFPFGFVDKACKIYNIN